MFVWTLLVLALIVANGAAWFTLLGAVKGIWKVLVGLGGTLTIVILVLLFASLIRLSVAQSPSTDVSGPALLA